MSESAPLLKLMAITATLTGKSIKLSGELLNVRSAMIHNKHGNDKPSLLLELALPVPDPCPDAECQCGLCVTKRSITSKNATALAHIMCEGASIDHGLMLDSTFVSEDGFHVKLRTMDGRYHVATGGNLTIALAHAITAALTPAS